jgi:hypothetical protein
LRAQKLSCESPNTAVLPRKDSSGLPSELTAASNKTLPVSNAPETRAEISGVRENGREAAIQELLLLEDMCQVI